MNITRITAVLALLGSFALAQNTWTFAVSGDSRNCGDIVMPAIAQGVRGDGAAFYWHLGDYRALYDFDQDYVAAFQQAHPNIPGARPEISDYLKNAWDDFMQNQLFPFGETPVFLGVGNHEFVYQKSRADLLVQFAEWFNRPEIIAQRHQDSATDRTMRTYYHWRRGGVDFITLDNASTDEFDGPQLAWFEAVLSKAARDDVKSVVVGMHEALPGSLSSGHSMEQSAQGIASGSRVYHDLVQFRANTHKQVYVLASHSHFYMANIFHTGQVEAELPGWIVGTAGAFRYQLPDGVTPGPDAMTNVYGYLLGTVSADGSMQFSYRKLEEPSAPAAVIAKYGQAAVDTCWNENRQRPKK